MKDQVTTQLNECLSDMDLATFCKKIGELITENGDQKVDAHKKIGISRSTLYTSFLTPEKIPNPTIKTLLATLDYLGYSLKVTKKE